MKMRAALAAVLVSSLAFFGSASLAADSSPADLTANGQEAVSELAKCLNTATSLDVFYLIDNSLSLGHQNGPDGTAGTADDVSGTDENIQRADIVQQDILRWGDIQELNTKLKIRVAGSFFSDNTSVISGWKALDSNTANSFKKTIQNKELDYNTNWLRGLQTAKDAFSSSQSNCKAIVWFTDGGLWTTSPRENSISAIEALCGQQISGSKLPSSPSKTGVVQAIRNDGITLFGVMLNTEASAKGDGSAGAKQESYWRSLMKSVVEGSGSNATSPGYGLPSGNLTCGQNDPIGNRTYKSGAFLQAKSAAEVAYNFLLLNGKVAGATSTPISANEKFWLDPGIANFEILTLSQNWQILDQDGKVHAQSSDATVATTGRLVNPNQQDSSEWTFKSDKDGMLQLFPQLTLHLDDKSLVSNRQTELTGQFLNADRVGADLGLFKSVDLEASAQGNALQAKITHLREGVFTLGELKPKENESIDFNAELSLSTAHYELEPLLFTVSKSVMPSSTLPAVEKITFTDPIENAKDNATASFKVIGPEQAGLTGQVCFNDPVVTGDPQPSAVGKPIKRMTGWKWKWTPDSKDESTKNCVVVASGETANVTLAASHPQAANSTVTAVENYSLVSDVVPLGVPDSQVISFETKTQTDQSAFWLWFLLLLIGGYALPLAALALLNKVSGKFSTTALTQRGEFDVEIDEFGVVTILDRPTDADLPDRFKRLPATLNQPTASYSDASGVLLQARLPKWPLNPIRYTMTARNGSVATGGGQVIPAPGSKLVSEAKQNLGNFGFFVASAEQREDFVSNKTSKAKLVVFGNSRNADAEYCASRIGSVSSLPGIYNLIRDGYGLAKNTTPEKAGRAPKAKSDKRWKSETGSVSLPGQDSLPGGNIYDNTLSTASAPDFGLPGQTDSLGLGLDSTDYDNKLPE